MQTRISQRFLTLLALIAVGIFTSGSSCDEGPSMLDGANGNVGRAAPSRDVVGKNGNTVGRDANNDTAVRDSNGETSTSDGPIACGEATCSAAQSCVDGTCVDDGDLRISLVWETKGDMDLHVRTPSGQELWYRNREGTFGARFQKDGCLQEACDDDNGPFIETVLWKGEAPHGQYQVWAVNYDQEKTINFRVEVLMKGEVKETFRGSTQGTSSKFVTCIGEDLQDNNCEPQEEPASNCYAELSRLGIQYNKVSGSTETAAGKQCTVKEHVMITGPINGINYRYYTQASGVGRTAMSCELAVKLHTFGNVLKTKGITDVLHMGAYNCRTIANSSNLSDHSFGKAIDIWSFKAGGTTYKLEDHWEHDTDTPSTAKGKVLYDIAHTSFNQGIFNTVLTPNYNADHDNHLHMDLKTGNHLLHNYVGADFLGAIDETTGAGCEGH